MATIAEALQWGLQQHRAGQFGHAEQIYRQILEQQPNHPDALHLLGLLASQSGRHQEAVRLLEQAVALDPSKALYRGNLGFAYLLSARYEEALAALDEAIRRDPHYPDALANRGAVIHALGRLEEAEASCRRCLELQPDHAAAHGNLGLILQDLARFPEAQRCFERAIELEPRSAAFHRNLGFVLLAMGDFSAGWTEYEHRLRSTDFNIEHFPQPLWDGSPLAGRTLLIHCEQGFGDTLQFIRYAKMIESRGGKMMVAAQPELISLLAESGYTNLVAQGDPLPAFDVHAPLMSLPRIFGTELDSVPRDVPYLTADRARISTWREELGKYQGLKVGIAWQGRKTFPGDRWRSIPLAYFAPLAQIARVQLFSLQKGPGSEQLAAVADRFAVVDLGGSLGAFHDTAAAMKSLDLVVTSDTAVAHLAGALGVRVWVALAHVSDWRWLLERSDTPWYPTMRLFRQSRPGDWDGVFQRIQSELDEDVKRAASIPS